MDDIVENAFCRSREVIGLQTTSHGKLRGKELSFERVSNTILQGIHKKNIVTLFLSKGVAAI